MLQQQLPRHRISLRASEDPYERIRQAAAYAIAFVCPKSKEGRKRLKQMVKDDPDQNVRKASKNALGKIGYHLGK